MWDDRNRRAFSVRLAEIFAPPFSFDQHRTQIKMTRIFAVVVMFCRLGVGAVQKKKQGDMVALL